ncbi:MAG: acyltransferase, partial [Bacteroidales bacterium]|nr:acyltransferase [Bacteroidales bacterium]
VDKIMKNTFRNAIFNILDDDSFNEAAIKIFRYQYENNHVYRNFADLLKVDPEKIESVTQIPFLPIEFFKSQKVVSYQSTSAGYFQSSGTTANTTSKHYYPKLDMYERSFVKGFENFFGQASDFCILALLPSYLEQQHSSLVYMVKKLIQLSGHPDSGFFLYDDAALRHKLLTLDAAGQKIILMGVTFALLDLPDKHQFELKNTVIIETGGMKGRRKEMVREELHHILCNSFGVGKIFSEYGMTELFSQAWSAGDGIFETPSWMKIMIRDVNDPLSYLYPGKTGGINVVDLANIDSCSFIATQDLGRMVAKDRFEVLGRFDNADIRGCNLLIA